MQADLLAGYLAVLSDHDLATFGRQIDHVLSSASSGALRAWYQRLYAAVASEQVARTERSSAAGGSVCVDLLQLMQAIDTPELAGLLLGFQAQFFNPTDYPRDHPLVMVACLLFQLCDLEMMRRGGDPQTGTPLVA